jgi:Flp pilus assembly protein TadD
MRRSILLAVGAGVLIALATPAIANDDSYGGYNTPDAKAADSGEMAKVHAAIDTKNWSSAVALLYPLAQSDPKNADLQNLLGYSYRMLGQYRQAFYYYDRALVVDPKHKGALEYEGEAYLETNQLPKAEVNLSRLKGACGGGCDEIAMLQSAIDRYKAKAKIN